MLLHGLNKAQFNSLVGESKLGPKYSNGERCGSCVGKEFGLIARAGPWCKACEWLFGNNRLLQLWIVQYDDRVVKLWSSAWLELLPDPEQTRSW